MELMPLTNHATKGSCGSQKEKGTHLQKPENGRKRKGFDLLLLWAHTSQLKTKGYLA
ncbi:DNA gyrase inhibitor SbmC [Sesbania bispinosa]|nr:DNA gyrase inhibitor SbmC [Sesbania bispinosa]